MRNARALWVSAIVLFASCEQPAVEREPPPAALPFVIIDNGANPFPVEVFTSPDRHPGSLLAEAPARGRSREIEFHPAPAGFDFFPRYLVRVEGIVFPFFPNPSGSSVIVPDAGRVLVPIQGLASLVEPDAPLAAGDRAWLSIRNLSQTRVWLRIGNEVQADLSGSADGINPGQTSVFGASPGNAPRYVLEGAEERPFPGSLPGLEGGAVYVLEFFGSQVRFLRRTPITLRGAS